MSISFDPHFSSDPTDQLRWWTARCEELRHQPHPVDCSENSFPYTQWVKVLGLSSWAPGHPINVFPDSLGALHPALETLWAPPWTPRLRQLFRLHWYQPDHSIPDPFGPVYFSTLLDALTPDSTLGLSNTIRVPYDFLSPDQVVAVITHPDAHRGLPQNLVEWYRVWHVVWDDPALFSRAAELLWHSHSEIPLNLLSTLVPEMSADQFQRFSHFANTRCAHSLQLFPLFSRHASRPLLRKALKALSRLKMNPLPHAPWLGPLHPEDLLTGPPTTQLQLLSHVLKAIVTGVLSESVLPPADAWAPACVATTVTPAPAHALTQLHAELDTAIDTLQVLHHTQHIYYWMATQPAARRAAALEYLRTYCGTPDRSVTLPTLRDVSLRWPILAEDPPDWLTTLPPRYLPLFQSVPDVGPMLYWRDEAQLHPLSALPPLD